MDPRPRVHRGDPRRERRGRRRRRALDAVRPRDLRDRARWPRAGASPRSTRCSTASSRTPTRSSGRPATTPAPPAGAATASSRTSRSRRSICAVSAASTGWRSSTGTCTTATARRRRSGRTRRARDLTAPGQPVPGRLGPSRRGRGRAGGGGDDQRAAPGGRGPRRVPRRVRPGRPPGARPLRAGLRARRERPRREHVRPARAHEPHERVLRRADRPRSSTPRASCATGGSCSATRAATRARTSPYCGLAIVERLAGRRTGVVDPWLDDDRTVAALPLRADEAAAVDAAARDSLARMAEILVTLNDAGEAYVGLAGPSRRRCASRSRSTRWRRPTGCPRSTAWSSTSTSTGGWSGIRITSSASSALSPALLDAARPG